MSDSGGSFGIASMTTFLARRQQVHQNQLISHITTSDLRTQNMTRGLQMRFQSHAPLSYDAVQKSWGAIYGIMQRQAAMLSFVEAFWVMGVIFWCMLPLVLLQRNARDLHPHRELSTVKQQVKMEERELVGVLDRRF